MIGKILSKRYELVEKVGSGGMAIVYKAKCTLLNRYVAVKILRPEFTNDKEAVAKFKRESQAVASLSHPNIVNLYDVGQDEDTYYLVMEYLDGKTLKEHILETAPLDKDTIINYTTQIANALKHAHENHVIHRDIKPHNILITKDDRIKVTDFGIAIAATSSTLTNVGNVIGSVHYFSPEQARGGYVDERSDLYSLGIVMYEMATGKLPFEAENAVSVALKQTQDEPKIPTEINPNIPKSIENIILKLMEKEQIKRFQSINELMVSLKGIKYTLNFPEDETENNLNDSPTQVMPIVQEERPAKTKKTTKSNRKNKKRIIVIAILIGLLILSTIVYAVVQINRSRPEDVEVPDFVGMNIDDAKVWAEEIGLMMDINTQHHETIPVNEIINQSPSGGMIVRDGSSVRVNVSQGTRTTTVPTIKFTEAIDVPTLLQNSRLTRGEVTYQFSEFPEGIVIEQSPAAGEVIREGASVDYIVSKGPEIQEVDMPNLIGLTIDEATSLINRQNLRVGSITREFSEMYDEGLVIEQSISPDKEVEENTPVNLIVSRGMISVPEIDEEEEEEGEEEEEEDEEDDQVEDGEVVELPENDDE
ncbi:Stk1 family PASTA domain-containing Ser/Thr kinase [Serpentinicella sp. ANB-PHB4]|uniref:Stk1 family PASTA domain-containing Ser/Thr kinase n=1 Tax=Serpentinicella sp. ANB-PHB4 TaxID=3074076 RepID=UPI0028651070|nr:Stk1 family PASTA domain-containing Ser/Thr kinase [Serpentinicella sp. ANB-PHB4]MDR5658317.1 Stk1 family PASTA domain-containing Ser/Thr kinase [Serpentinicella sp. ANB-PHB4]